MEEVKTQTQEETNLKIGEYHESEKAKADLIKQGMRFPAMPAIPLWNQDGDGAFVMPADITVLHPQQLGQLYSLVTGLAVYYGTLVAKMDIDRTTAERVRDFTVAQVSLELDLSDPEIKKKYPNREFQDAYVKQDPRCIQAENWYAQCNATFILAEALQKGYEKNLNLVSREITRRSNFQQFENRGDNLR